MRLFYIALLAMTFALPAFVAAEGGCGGNECKCADCKDAGCNCDDCGCESCKGK